tara:strand:- start:448 stop:687 length:240 start_codon:yes stop_codon:yes gene_type:complete
MSSSLRKVQVEMKTYTGKTLNSNPLAILRTKTLIKTQAFRTFKNKSSVMIEKRKSVQRSKNRKTRRKTVEKGACLILTS